MNLGEGIMVLAGCLCLLGVGLIITFSPYYCWQCLKAIKKQHEEESKLRSKQLTQIEGYLKEIAERLATIADANEGHSAN